MLRALALETPPNVVEGHPFAAIAELIKSGRIANRLRQLGLDLQRELLDLFTNSAGNYLDGWFESDPIKAVYGFDGVVGNYASPYTPGSAYVLLHHCFGEVNGKKGAWGHAIGGMGAITQAMAKSAARARRRDPRRCAGARGDRREGQGGRRGDREGRSDPRPRGDLQPQSETALPHADRSRGAAAGVRRAHREMALRLRHVPHERRACRSLPDFTCLPGRALAEHHTAGIIIAPSLDYMEQAYFDARTHGWSKQPIVEMVISSTLDDTLAPKGQHVASLFCQHVAPELPDGRRGTIIARQSPT